MPSSLGGVEEAGELVGEGGRMIVDESVENERGCMQGKDVIVGDSGWDESGVACMKEDFLTSAPDTDLAIAPDAHGNDETIVFAKVAMERSEDLHHPDIEIGRVDDLNSPVGCIVVFCAIVGFYVEVEGLSGEVCMELAGLAIHARAVVVKDAIGDIGGLLDFGQQDATTNGMDSACGKVEYIASLNLMVGEDFNDTAVLYPLLVFIGGDILFEAGIEVGAFIGPDDVPHLGFAHLAVLALRHVVVGMDLNAEVALSIDELYQ
jgi:hypothetical protein